MEYICNDCPRKCGVLKTEHEISGFCSSYSLPSVSRVAPHFGEEPCITGRFGSGTVFFSGCNLKCVFCQNMDISKNACGKLLSVSELADEFKSLEDSGVHNINLVTGTHFTRTVSEALRLAKVNIPVIWNSSAYELPETLRMLDGLVQVYLPDLKYLRSSLSASYSYASDYPQIAQAAIDEMFRQTGPYQLDNNDMLTHGVLIRHLILPEQEQNTMDVIDYVSEHFKSGDVLFSLMSQYTPPQNTQFIRDNSELLSPVNSELSEWMLSYLNRKRNIDGYWQDVSSATAEMLPLFNTSEIIT